MVELPIGNSASANWELFRTFVVVQRSSRHSSDTHAKTNCSVAGAQNIWLKLFSQLYKARFKWLLKGSHLLTKLMNITERGGGHIFVAIFLYNILRLYSTLQNPNIYNICNMAVNLLEWSTMFSSQVWAERAEDRDSCQSANRALHAGPVNMKFK